MCKGSMNIKGYNSGMGETILKNSTVLKNDILYFNLKIITKYRAETISHCLYL